MWILIKWYLYAIYLRLFKLKDSFCTVEDISILKNNLANSAYFNYPNVAGDIPYKEKFRNREFKVFSQNGEDGLLLYIFSQIGTTNHTFVEFGIEDGRECNTANLSINFGWNGLLLEGSEKQVKKARSFYQSINRFDFSQPNIKQCFVTTENINSVIQQNNIEGEIDLLSVDIDGNDYWLWLAINAVNPRAVVVEYNSSFGAEKSITVKYDPSFTRFAKHKSGWYHGASLLALVKLANKKGYTFVGADSSGVNAFFVRNDALKGELEEVSVACAFYHQLKRHKIASLKKQFELIQHLDYVDV